MEANKIIFMSDAVSPSSPYILRGSDALLVIDMQNDFCPGGALPVKDGDAIVPLVNSLAGHFEHTILTQDWHPAGHISFATSHVGKTAFETVEVEYGPQALWPDHCLQHSAGAELHAGLQIPQAELILRKGFRQEIDSYSAFLENDHRTPTGLAGYLKERGIERLFLCGLAYDFCVHFSAIDGVAMGFEMVVIEDATRAVDLPGSVAQTRADLAVARVRRINSGQVSGGC